MIIHIAFNISTERLKQCPMLRKIGKHTLHHNYVACTASNTQIIHSSDWANDIVAYDVP